MIFILKLIVALIVILLALAFFRTWQVENSENQIIFASSTAPTALDGFHKGSVNLPVKVTWLGKKFNAASSTGINVFDENGTSTEKYPFKTSLKGSVLHIDYDVPENPFWVRPILDQLVETAPGSYLGKMTLRIIPNYPFSIGFFKLQK